MKTSKLSCQQVKC